MVRAVARYANKPSEVHWRTAIGILGYVFSTSDFGIMFEKGSGLELVAFADADYASKANDRGSVYGGARMCTRGRVCWFSRTQKCVTLSTTEAEYVALADTINEAMFMRYVWSFIFPGLGRRTLRFSRIMRGQGTWHKIQCVRRTRSTSTFDTLFCGSLFLRGVSYYPCRVGGAACRLLEKAAQQRGFPLPPRFSDEY